MCSPYGRRSPVVKAPDTVTVFDKEMGINHRDFFRILPTALGTTEYERTGTRIRMENGDQCLEISLGPEGKRTIALMTLPMTQVTLRFTNYGETELTRALARFDLYFRRGGG
jgi:hypothetical protein